MSQCLLPTSTQQVKCILTYGGHRDDLIINYLLLSLNLIAAILTMEKTERSIPLFVPGRNTRRNARVTAALIALTFVIVFQVSLCILVQCVGISIVWCALLGWIVALRRELNVLRRDAVMFSRQQPLLDADYNMEESNEEEQPPLSTPAITSMALLSSLAGITYYAVISHPITTVAHVSALILGAIIGRITTFNFPYTPHISNNNNDTGTNEETDEREADSAIEILQEHVISDLRPNSLNITEPLSQSYTDE